MSFHNIKQIASDNENNTNHGLLNLINKYFRYVRGSKKKNLVSSLI